MVVFQEGIVRDKVIMHEILYVSSEGTKGGLAELQAKRAQ